MTLSIKNIQNTLENLEKMRVVTLTIFVQAEASGQRKDETGLDFSSVVSPNHFTFPPVIDTLDTSDLETIRSVWLQANKRKKSESVLLAEGAGEESLEDKLGRLLGEAVRDSDNENVQASFIQAAKYPVPSEYVVRLPEPPNPLRQEILETLVPFQESRAMLLRLENTLDLPLRTVMVGHTRAHRVDELKASIQ